MIENVLVTVKIQGSAAEYDLELPAAVPVKELAALLLEALKSLNKQMFAQASNFRIMFNAENRFLEEDETLMKAAVWDGSIITIMKT